MRSILFFLSMSLCGSVCFGQVDSTQRPQPRPSPQTRVPIPGIDTPMSGPGTLLQSSPNPHAAARGRKGRKGKFKTNPPTDPRAFGIAVPLEQPKKDSLRP